MEAAIAFPTCVSCPSTFSGRSRVFFPLTGNQFSRRYRCERLVMLAAGKEREKRRRLVEVMEGLEREAIMGEDEGKEAADYNRRAQIFEESSNLFRQPLDEEDGDEEDEDEERISHPKEEEKEEEGEKA